MVAPGRERLRRSLRWPTLALLVLLLGFYLRTFHTGILWCGQGGGYFQIGWGAVSVGLNLPTPPLSPGWSLQYGGTPDFSFGLEQSGAGWVAIIPLWAPAIGLAIVAAALFRTPRVRAGSCPACGYDRARLADPSVCPECGAGAKP